MWISTSISKQEGCYSLLVFTIEQGTAVDWKYFEDFEVFWSVAEWNFYSKCICFFLLSSQDKEVECGGPAPRVLSLDDYFITEVEKEERDPDTGKKVKKKVVLILLLFLTKK